MARLAHAHESAGSSGGQDGVQHVAARSQRSAGQDASTAGPPESARMFSHICAKHGSANQCAWLASTGPSHGRGLTGRRHARWRVSLARLKASSGTYPGQQPRRRAGERETACCRRRMQRLSGQRPSGPSLERSRRSSSATAIRLVADVLELVADVVLARQCLRLDT